MKSVLKPHHADASDEHASPATRDMAEGGVAKAEAARSFAHSNWTLLGLAWVGIGLVSYVNGMDNQSMYAWLTYGTTYFGAYLTAYSALSVVQQVLIGVMKLPIARLADMFGRAQVYVLSIACYTVGFVIVAASQNMAAIWAGVAIYATGNTGTSIMQQIVIADWVPTRYRALAIGLVSLPFIINFAVVPKIVQAICPSQTCGTSSTGGWRWGAGMMSILVPVSSIVIIAILAYSQWRARREGLTQSLRQRWGGVLAFLKALDVPGMILLIAGWVLFLLAINLAGGDKHLWKEAHTIVMIILGPVCLAVLVVWEMYFAQEPLIRKRYLTNKDVMLPMVIGVTDFFAFYCSWLNLSMWALIVRADWNNSGATYFSLCQSLTLTVFGILGGVLSAFTRRLKWQMFAGACIRMLGIGLMIAFRHQGVTTAQLVIPQIIQGAGGGIMGVQLQVAAQVSVPHADVAMVTAFVLLMTEVGGAIGSAVAGAVQKTVIPRELAKLAPNLTPAEVTTAAGAPLNVIIKPDWAMGTPNRTALIEAYARYWHIMLIIAICVSAVPIISSALLTNYKLGSQQTLVDDTGCRIDQDDEDASRDQKLASVGHDDGRPDSDLKESVSPQGGMGLEGEPLEKVASSHNNPVSSASQHKHDDA